MSVKFETVIHEAGHAVMCFLEGIKIYKISIMPTGDVLGYVRHENPLFGRDLGWDDDQHKDTVFSNVRVLLGGVSAELNHFNDIDKEDFSEGFGDDLHEAVERLTFYISSNKEIGETIDELIKEVRQTLKQPKCAKTIEALSQALMEKKQLEPEEVKAIISKTGLRKEE